MSCTSKKSPLTLAASRETRSPLGCPTGSPRAKDSPSSTRSRGGRRSRCGPWGGRANSIAKVQTQLQPFVRRRFSLYFQCGGGGWIRTSVGLPRRIYSPLHLTALPPLHGRTPVSAGAIWHGPGAVNTGARPRPSAPAVEAPRPAAAARGLHALRAARQLRHDRAARLGGHRGPAGDLLDGAVAADADARSRDAPRRP